MIENGDEGVFGSCSPFFSILVTSLSTISLMNLEELNAQVYVPFSSVSTINIVNAFPHPYLLFNDARLKVKEVHIIPQLLPKIIPG